MELQESLDIATARDASAVRASLPETSVSIQVLAMKDGGGWFASGSCQRAIAPVSSKVSVGAMNDSVLEFLQLTSRHRYRIVGLHPCVFGPVRVRKLSDIFPSSDQGALHGA